MESPTKYISYDFSYLHQEFLEIINDFSEGLRLEKVQNTIGKRLLKQIQSQISQILTRLEADFVLVVIGDFKRGKSTLINALLGQSVVTTDVTTETVTINHIQYGSEPKIHVCLSDGGQIQIEAEELKSEQLSSILETLPQTASHLKIETPVEWLRGVRLVDTPGTGDVFKRFDRQVHTYLLQADAVVFVVSALSPFAESEQKFLQMSVLPQDFPKVFFTLNMMDNIQTEQEVERLLKSTKKKISRLFPNPQLFGISAFDEFCRLESLPRPNPASASKLEKSFNEFRKSLEESIHLQRDLIQLDRATDHLEQTLQEFSDSLLLLRNAMQTDRERLSRAIDQCEDPTSELSAKIAQHIKVMKDDMNQMCDQACQWMNEFMNRLETEAIAGIANFKVEEIKRHFQLFLTNSLREAINNCLSVHKPSLFETIKKVQKAIVRDLQLLTDVSSSIVDGKSSGEKVTSHEHPWINFDALEILAECEPSTFVADLIIRKTQELGPSRQAVSYQQKLQIALPDFKLAIIQEIRSLYNSIATKLEQQIESAYHQDIEISVSAMRQAQEVSAKEVLTVSAANETLQDTLLLLNDIHSRLKKLKQKLCSEDML
ncbi:MAG: dynamin family protein [Nostoc sp.]|uniref:dynamin family protein n=1 Tax=Nostoc sp. TaxID=1180 RepID=UPI002FF92AB9